MQESLLKYGKETLAHKNDELKWKEVKLSDIIKHTMTKGECTFIILGKAQLLVSYNYTKIMSYFQHFNPNA